jgi:hypothetical protein
MAKQDVLQRNDVLRQWLNIFFAVSQIATGSFAQLTGIGKSIQSQSNRFETPVIPSGYAFAIWGLIFSAALVYSVYQLSPSQKANPLLRKIGFWTAAAFAGNTAWQLVAQLLTFNWPTVIIIIFVLYCSLKALLNFTEYRSIYKLTNKENNIVGILVGSLAGWVSAATFANLSSVLNQLNITFGLSINALSLIIITTASLFAGYIIYRFRGNGWYTSAVVWAFVAIFLANIRDTQNSNVAFPTLFLTVLVLCIFLYTHMNQKSAA